MGQYIVLWEYKPKLTTVPIPKLIFALAFACISTWHVYAQTASAPAFSLCADAENWPYYHPALKYRGGFWEIKNHFNTKFPNAAFEKMPKNTGIVSVHFWVNCKGEPGDYTVQCCDFNYKPAEVHPEIVKRLVQLTTELKDWIPGAMEGKVVNSHKFFTFRIDHGKLIDILPK